MAILQNLLLLSIWVQLLNVRKCESTTGTKALITTTPNTLPWLHPVLPPPKQSSLPLCSNRIAENCFLPGPTAMPWESAHNFCRSRGGFLIAKDEQLKSVSAYWPPLDQTIEVEDEDSSFRLRNLSVQDLSWTALTRHNGHYQWLSQYPDYFAAVGQFIAWSPPNKCSQECAGHDVRSQRTHLLSCCQPLHFFCYLPEISAWQGDVDPRDVELRVTSNMASNDGWVEVAEIDFAKLVIGCSAFHTKTGQPLDVQPSIFWSKDGVYIDSHVRKLLPATFYDASKYDVSRDESRTAHPELKQGTFWCESWVPHSPARIVSNKILVTLREWIVLIADTKKEEPFSTECTQEPVERIRDTFKPVLSNIGNYTVDISSVQKDVSKDRKTMLVSYRYLIHVPMCDNCLEFLLDGMENKGNQYKKLYEINGYLNTSTVYFGTYCLQQQMKYHYGNTIVWPFSRAGKINPTNFRCRSTNNKLIPGYCKWNYTHGATIEFNPSDCKNFESCPLGYIGISNNLCLFISPLDTWGVGMMEMYKIIDEVSILDTLNSFLNDSGSNINYDFVKQVITKNTGGSKMWLPLKRVIDNGPLEYFGTGQLNYPYRNYNQSRMYNISWGHDEPSSGQNCLALNLESNSLLTLDCNHALPFISLLNVSGLKEIPKSTWKFSIPELITEDSRCPEDWNSSGLYHKKVICFKLFLNNENTTWVGAKRFCKQRDAELPTPGKSFLDWVFRQYLHNQNVSSVWMAEESVYEDGHIMDYVNWKASTDYSLMYGSLSVDGWERENGESVKSNILCQREMTFRNDPRMQLHKVKKRRSKSLGPRSKGSIYTICLELTNIPEEGLKDIRCLVNGKKVPLKQKNKPSCAFTIGSQQGYYRCYLWLKTPSFHIESNEILNMATDILTFSVTLVQSALYMPAIHDSTFTYETDNDYTTDCVISFKNVIEREIINITILAKNVFYTPGKIDLTLFHNFNIEMKSRSPSDVLLDEYDMLMKLPLFSKDRNFSGCELFSIKSSVSCLGESTKVCGINVKNLSWPTVQGNKIVLPSELCINDKGEPVYRECEGSFFQGYHWGNMSDDCTGEPTNITKALWNISHNENSSDLKKMSNLISDGPSLLPADIHFVATKLQQLSRQGVPYEMELDDVVEILNSVMGADEDAFEVVQQKLNTSGILFEAFENIAFKIKLPPANGDKAVNATRKLISVERLELDINSPVIGYQCVDGGKTQVTIKKNYDEKSINGDAAIIFPENLTYIVANTQSEIAMERVRITFAIYRTPKLFQDHLSFPNHSVKGDILQASYDGKVVKNLDEPVRLLFRRSAKGNDAKCVFWDFGKNQGLGGWSTDGCWKGVSMDDYDICLCNHLTCFARLINYDEDGFDGIHAIALDIITIIGCILSIIGLLMVFATFCLFKKWRRSLSNKILVNLSISVFCSLVIFLAGINQTWNVLLCRSVAVSLHYFILASFGWMLVEAVHQYLKFVKVIGTYIPRFLWKASVSAWGLPLVPIIVVLVYDSKLYDNKSSDDYEDKICWMSSECFLYAFLPPLAVTMLINLIMFVLIIRGAVCGRARVNSTLSERSLFKSQLSMAVCIFCLLGFTWIFGLLSIWKARLLFSYLFCIFNTLQGFFIFLFHLCRERTARRLWKDFLSVITKAPVSTSDPVHSNNINSRQDHRYHLENVTYNQGGGILVLPRRASAASTITRVSCKP